jgi:hypothetical protein
MRSALQSLLITGAFCLVATIACADSEIVIAIRYLQAQATSHSHLYLYQESGKLLRQLTNDNSGQDSGPIFSPDGETIVFTREKPDDTRELWSVKPGGTDLKKLDAAPDWYAQAKSSPYFTSVEPQKAGSANATSSPAESASPIEIPVPNYKSPDGLFELILAVNPNDENDQINGPGHGKNFVLRDLKTGTETEFSKIPGFYGAFGLLHDNQDENQHFIFDGPLRLAFFDLHLNSTDGDTVFALDLTGPRLVRLSPNWATPIPLPGEAAFLTVTENRYVPILASNKTANCSYIEHWDDKLDRIRYAREKSAAVCYGMSMYRPDLTPAVISWRRSSE